MVIAMAEFLGLGGTGFAQAERILNISDVDAESLVVRHPHRK